MASDDKEFVHESLQDRKSIVRYLAALGDGFQKGKLLLARNSEQLTLETPELVKFDLRAKQKNDSAQMVLKISWKKPKKGKSLKVEPLVIEGTAEEGT